MAVSLAFESLTCPEYSSCRERFFGALPATNLSDLRCDSAEAGLAGAYHGF